MRNKRIKGYWVKRKEELTSLTEAKARANILRNNEHISHVVIEDTQGKYLVCYSVAKWYWEECKRLGISI